jgi:hypothetical protein
VDGQAEVKDTALSTKGDTFANPYRDFRTSLRIDWQVEGSASDVAAGVFTLGGTTAGTAVFVAQMNRDHGTVRSPWSTSTGDDGAESGTYGQLCWRPYPRKKYFNTTAKGSPEAPTPLSDATTRASLPASEAQQKQARDMLGPLGPVAAFLPPVGFMDDPTGRDVVGWLGFVLARYVADFNFKLDVQANVSTFTVTKLFYEAWTSVQTYAKVLLEAGAKTDAATGVDR